MRVILESVELCRLCLVLPKAIPSWEVVVCGKETERLNSAISFNIHHR